MVPRPRFPRTRFRRDRRGGVAVMTAMLLTPLLGAVALTTDASIWLVEQHRLQIAADAAAHAAALQLGNTALQTGAPGSFATLVLNEAKAATGGASLIGTLNTPVVTVASGYSSVTVALTSKADTFFANAVRSSPVTLHATATAGVTAAAPCVLTLAPSASQALNVGGPNGSGSIVASGCPVFSNSSSASAIYVNSGTITATSVGTHGGLTKTSSGSNTVSPTPTTGAAAQTDPVGSRYTLPSTGSCTYNNISYTAYKSTAYALQPGTYCGTTTIGGNGSSDTFAPGTYIFTGNVTINNANITQAAGVTFIMVGATSATKAGSFTWQNNSAATMTAPTSGAMAGLLFWQACPTGAVAGSTGNGLINFNGGSALTASGTVYAPCGTVQLDNNAQVKAVTGSNFGLVSSVLNVWQSASLQPASTKDSSSGASQVTLTQ